MPPLTYLLLLLFSLTLSTHAFDYCAQALSYTYPNASHTYIIPGVDSSSSPTTSNSTALNAPARTILSPSDKDWTLTATLSAARNHAGQLALNTNIWLDASSTDPGADNATRPYRGCTIALPDPDPTKGIRDGPSDDGNCSAVLGAECVAAYRKLFGELAGQYARQGQKEMRSQSWDDACAQLGSAVFHNALPEGCGVLDRQGNRGAGAFCACVSSSSCFSFRVLSRLPGVKTKGKANVDVALNFKRPNLSNCSAPVPRTPIPLLGLGDFYDAAPDNFSAYDRHIRDVVPVVLAMFTNSSTEPQQLPWSDTGFVCMSAKDVAPGSRVPPPVSTLAAPRVCSMRWLSFGLVVALVVVFGF